MSEKQSENVRLKKLQKKKQVVSWLGAGVKARNLQALQALAEKDLRRRTDLEGNNVIPDKDNNTFQMSEIENFSEKSNYVSKLEISQSNLQLNMMCRSSVLVLVQDNKTALNVPGGFSQNRLAPPTINNPSKSGI